MRTRPALAAALTGFLAAGPASAQTPPCGGCGGSAPVKPVGVGLAARVSVPGGSSTLFPPPGSDVASTPGQAALERLNLRSEWTAYVPMDGRADGMGPVQVVDGGQIFIQTRAGRLVALDAGTGATLWTFRYPKGYANLFPVGVTERLVFALNVNTLYCFARYTGLLEFEYDLPGLMFAGTGGPAAGPVADDRYVYVPLGSNRVVAYTYPAPLTVPPRVPATVGPDGRTVVPSAGGPSVPQQVADRYAGTGNLRVGADPFGFRRLQTVADYEDRSIALGSEQRTPSITALGRVTPPYRLAQGVSTPSITSVASLRQPYTSRPVNLQYNQATPSIAVTRSVAAVTSLSNLRPRMLEPISAWSGLSPARTIYEPIQTASQLWFTTESPLAYGLTKDAGARRGPLPLSAAPAAPPAGPVATPDGLLLGFFAEEDGTVAAVDLPTSTQLAPRVEWRANVGGYLNHKPVPTADGVYASGENAGVARIDLRTGDVTWRTEGNADRLLAVNDEFAYVLNRRGSLLVYPRTVPNNPAAPMAQAVGQLNLPGFDVPVTNEITDRVLVGAHSGLLVCLRDASAKYTRPARIIPPAAPSRSPEEKPLAPDAPK